MRNRPEHAIVRPSRTIARARSILAIILICFGGVESHGCSGRPAAVEVEDAFVIPPGTEFAALWAARFGELSGLAFDATTGELFALSDDRVDSRVFRLRLQDSPLRLEPTGVILFRGGPDPIDPEGLALLPDGHMLVASEGIQSAELRLPPAILEYTRDGTFVRALQVPDKYVPPEQGVALHGVRANSSFESLASTADGGRLFTAAETALLQDGELADFDRGARTRLLEYTRQGERFVPGREWAYELDAVARPDFPVGSFTNGLVELVALGDTELLALERSYAEEVGGGRVLLRIRVYRVSLVGASEVSDLESIRGRSDVRPVSKQLLFDLGSTPGLPSSLVRLENFEGMTLLPATRGDRRRLLLVSDDNFSVRQRTWFVRLAIP